jgi:hypothetical protein
VVIPRRLRSQQRLPALGALPVAVLNGEQLLLAVRARADHHQGADRDARFIQLRGCLAEAMTQLRIV